MEYGFNVRDIKKQKQNKKELNAWVCAKNVIPLKWTYNTYEIVKIESQPHLLSICHAKPANSFHHPWARRAEIPTTHPCRMKLFSILYFNCNCKQSCFTCFENQCQPRNCPLALQFLSTLFRNKENKMHIAHTHTRTNSHVKRSIEDLLFDICMSYAKHFMLNVNFLKCSLFLSRDGDTIARPTFWLNNS